MMYAQVIVSYDIADTKMRTKLFEALKDQGLRPIQKSLFWGYVLPSERRMILRLFEEYCNIETDKAILTNVTLDQNIRETFGYDREDFVHPEGYEII